MENLLLNILFVLLPILVFQIFFLANESKLKEKLLGLVFFISIILCLNFPINTYEGFQFDLRFISFALGAIYGGRNIAIFLYITLLVSRFMIGGGGFYITLIDSSVLLILFLFFIIPNYHLYSLKKKIIGSIVLFAAISLESLLLFQFMTGSIFLLPTNIFVSFFIIQSITGGLSVYLLEYLITMDIIKKQVFHNEKLRSLSEMAASISHEVRNPLTVTRGFLQLLRSSNIDNDKKEKYLSLSLSELDRAESIITDFLSYAKPYDHVDVEVLRVRKELKYIVSVMNPYALMKNVHIVNDELEDGSIIGNKKQFHQCLINLAKNAIEAMPKGGVLEFKVYKKNDKIDILLLDNGIGMTASQIAKLGVPYFSNKEKGTGLGTMVAFSVVTAMNGQIYVESNYGEGTVFTISIPEYNEKN